MIGPASVALRFAAASAMFMLMQHITSTGQSRTFIPIGVQESRVWDGSYKRRRTVAPVDGQSSYAWLLEKDASRVLAVRIRGL